MIVDAVSTRARHEGSARYVSSFLGGHLHDLAVERLEECLAVVRGQQRAQPLRDLWVNGGHARIMRWPALVQHGLRMFEVRLAAPNAQ